MDNNIKTLPVGYILQGKAYRYEIKKVLGHGAFGITYLASMEIEVEGPLGKIKTSSPVTIKEFFMSELNGRNEDSVTTGGESSLFSNYKRKFTREAENISQLKHKNIVNVLEYFEANNTVYYVMEYLRNGSLEDFIEKKGHLTENETLAFTAQICEALKYMHSRQMLHLDLKPKNIMLNDRNEVVLIDFGLSKHYDEKGNPESSTTIGGGTPGYAPIEQAQYEQDGNFQATLDIYALGATMFKMITGQRPPEASKILNDGFPDSILEKAGADKRIIDIIEKAMMPQKKQRYQTVDELLSDLDFSSATKAAPITDADSEKTQITSDNHDKSSDETEIQNQETPNIADETELGDSKDYNEDTNKQEYDYEDEEDDDKSKLKRLIIIAVSCIIGIFIIVIFLNYNSNQYEDDINEVVAVDNTDTDTTLSSTESLIEETPQKSEEYIPEPQKENISQTHQKTEEEISEIPQKENINQPPLRPEEKEEVFSAVEQMPQFPGGDAELMKWLCNNIQYPTIAQENNIQGRVIIQFVVTKTGAIGEVKVVKSVDRNLDKEAKRLVKNLPNFIPGKMNGQPVNVWYTIPISFKLQ